jgi:hypothetical protein
VLLLAVLGWACGEDPPNTPPNAVGTGGNGGTAGTAQGGAGEELPPEPLAGVFSEQAALTKARSSFAAVGVDRSIFLFGGLSGGTNAIASADRYDVDSQSESAMTDVPLAVAGASALVDAGAAYIFCGLENVNGPTVTPRDACQKVVLDSSEWSTCAALGNGPNTHGFATLDGQGRGFLFGGLRFIDFSAGSRPTKIVQGYDFEQDSWTAETTMPQFRDGAAVVIHGGRAFVIGGRTIDESNGTISAPAELLVYDFQSYQWRSDIAAPMLTPRVGLACAVRRGFVYCFGGSDISGKPLATVDRFELATLQWASLPDLPSPRYNAQAVALSDAVYLLGGKDSADNASASVFRLE